jgi:excisionase family DNA binding protein
MRTERLTPTQILYTPEEAAHRLRCGRTTVYALIKSGELRARKLGSLTRISDDDLQALIGALPERVTEAA